ncbi:hypothetical protein NEOLI_004948 [Neolecta irregularis DAH-3]|uniref:Uncharacterized protein n=1 Tax=Neolecta irregularis (strain DAH-3) TaxID=1198029 RepID=A0A1U7LMC1_NEOID|nr:hypothetical protein NEOLI_004948 [Neolecta irregularis DAH-3]|eukprot:OLL23805.1 hypothetical protein NEOLI_004948 [Neolecta irregularis DAH-3]
MCTGNKRFERLKWSFDNVLVGPIEFLLLFDENDGLDPFNAEKIEISLEIKQSVQQIFTPNFLERDTFPQKSDEWKESISEIYEWIALALLDADRDKILPLSSTPTV